MVRYCCVRECKSGSAKKKVLLNKTSFYRFPIIRNRYSQANQKLLHQQRLAWLAAVRRNDLFDKRLDSLRICSEHFASGKPSDFHDVENPDWVPHLNMGYEASDDDSEKENYLAEEVEPPCSVEEANYCAEENEPSCSVEQIIEDQFKMTEESGVGTQTDWSSTSVNLQTDLRSSHIAALEAELVKRNEEICELRAQLADALWMEESFKNDDKKMSYYSGLPSYRLFKLILDQMESALSTVKCNKIDNFQKLLLTLMKLRFNLPFMDLAYRFRISGASARSCFREVIVLISYIFQEVVHWPERKLLQSATPRCFKEAFGNSLAVIIDYFEMPTQRPAKARAKSFSNDENNFTAKYMVGITPHGFVPFISDGWEGHASDEFILVESGLLENLLAGDVVMSDRGFIIKESVSMHYAELSTPEFLCNEMQLAPQDVEKTKKIASVRFHVERIIGFIKNKFHILKGPIPNDLLIYKHNGKPILDCVVRTVCILINLCDAIDPVEKPHTKNENANVLRDK